MWGASGSGSRQTINYGIAADMGMVGLRDVLVVAPAASFHPNAHHHHHHHHHDGLIPSTDHHPIIPLLTATPCLVDDDGANPRAGKSGPTGIQFWQQAQQNQNPNPSLPYLRKPVPMLDAASGLLSGGGGGTATCQDCGNQAKKDCTHRRCRTCCKSRGFDCSTHVKSTWVPAARRRERHQISAPGAGAGAGSSASTSAPKKPRLISSQNTTTSHTSTSNTTPPRSFDTTSSHQDASFRESLPGQVRAPAVFKCVRVTSIDDGDDEYAYQAMVKIGGHVFKGFLYDQGADDGRGGGDQTLIATTGDSNASGIPNISELHLGGVGSSGGTAARNGAAVASSSGMISTPDVFGGSGGLLGGTNYGNPIN